jgi:hypothetical protein
LSARSLLAAAQEGLPPLPTRATATLPRVQAAFVQQAAALAVAARVWWELQQAQGGVAVGGAVLAAARTVVRDVMLDYPYPSYAEEPALAAAGAPPPYQPGQVPAA